MTASAPFAVNVTAAATPIDLTGNRRGVAAVFRVEIQNVGTADAWIGWDATVTPLNGQRLAPDATYWFEGVEEGMTLYAVTSGGTTDLRPIVYT